MTLIPYAAGYFSIRDMAKATGIVMTVGAAVCVALTQYFYRLVGVMPGL